MKWLLFVESSAVVGREVEFNDWYDNVHIDDVCSIKGVVRASRYVIESNDHSVPHRYLATYELDREPTAVWADLDEKSKSGGFLYSDSINRETVTSILWRQR